jgi:bifunctional polynucleotide phosphatase/kinase
MEERQIIVMCGLPGAGKTTYISEHYNDASKYYIVDGDTMKTSANVVKAISNELDTNLNIVVDATNFSLERRADIISLAQKHKIPVECIYITTPKSECIARTKKRHADGGKNVPASAIGRLANLFVAPTLDEGFALIRAI